MVLYGSTGRIGSSILNQLAEFSIRIETPSKDTALMAAVNPLDKVNKLVLIYAIPHRAMVERLLELESHREILGSHATTVIVIDCSGHVKLNIPDYWHILQNLPWKNYRETHKGPLYYIGNPGCMASAVIQGIRASNLCWKGTNISVTAIGGKSFAPPSRNECNTLRTAKRWTSHHHVREIEQVFHEEQIHVSSFVPVISSALDNGLLVVVSGQIKRTEFNIIARASECVNATRGTVQVVTDGSEVSLSDVVGTSVLKMRSDTSENADTIDVTVAVGLDNVEYIAYLAVSTVLIVTAN